MQVSETPYSRLTLCEDGVIEAHPIDRTAPRTGALLGETMALLLRMTDGTPRPVLWDPSGTLPLSPDGWKEIVEGIEEAISALAIVLPDEEVPLLGPFPEAISSMLIPVRTFLDPVEARDWLLGFVD